LPYELTEEKPDMVLSGDAEKMCDKIQHPFMMETLRRLGTEGKGHPQFDKEASIETFS
jgi:hypothetical protein